MLYIITPMDESGVASETH